MWGPGTWQNRQARYRGKSFGWQMVYLHITRTFHTQLSYQAHQEQMTIRHSPISTLTHHQSIHHTRRQSNARIGWMCQSHPRNDRQSKELPSRTGLTTYPWCSTSSCTNKSPTIQRNHHPRPFLQHATSSKGECTNKHAHIPYQWQQSNHRIHANAGTNSESAYRCPYSQTN